MSDKCKCSREDCPSCMFPESAPASCSALPCPFCGSSNITVEWEHCEPLTEGDTNRRWFAECAKCCAQGPFCQKEPEVIPAWNRRADSSLLNAIGAGEWDIHFNHHCCGFTVFHRGQTIGHGDTIRDAVTHAVASQNSQLNEPSA